MAVVQIVALQIIKKDVQEAIFTGMIHVATKKVLFNIAKMDVRAIHAKIIIIM